MSVLKTVVIGNVGKVDVKDKFTKFGVAHNKSKKVDGEWETEVIWINVVGFGQMKERMAKIKTGDCVYIQGEPQVSIFKEKAQLSVIVSYLNKLRNAEAKPESEKPSEDDDDLPF